MVSYPYWMLERQKLNLLELDGQSESNLNDLISNKKISNELSDIAEEEEFMNGKFLTLQEKCKKPESDKAKFIEGAVFNEGAIVSFFF